MAIITSLIRDTTKEFKKAKTTEANAIHNAGTEFFSIWSSGSNNRQCIGHYSQNMQFNKETAKILRDALNDFLIDT